MYVEACDRVPHEPELWQERGELAYAMGELDEAGSCLFTSADIYARAARFDIALELMGQVVDIEPEREDARRFERFLRRRVVALREAEARVREPARESAGEPSSSAASSDAEIDAALSELDASALEVAGAEDDAGDENAAARDAIAAPPGVPLAHAQAVLRAVLEAGLLPSMRSDQMRRLFDEGRVIELAEGTPAAALPVAAHACLVVEGVVEIEGAAPGAKTVYSRGEVFGERALSRDAAMFSLSAAALLLAVPCEMLVELERCAAMAQSSAA